MARKKVAPLVFIAIVLVGFALAFMLHEGPVVPFIYTFF
jgi:hypothetical protein